MIALYRTDRGRFALDEAGSLGPSNKSTLVVGREPDAPVAYLCGLLNSELLDLWYAVRGKTPWHVRRNYEPKRMNEMPYRRPEGDPRAEQVETIVGGKAVDDVGSVELPKDLSELETLAAERAALVRELLADGRRLVEQVERLVCALYDVPDELADEVVAHAVARAGVSQPFEG